MIILKPVWVDHEGNKPIFSVDIHPKGGRFATGGQGGAGGRIVVWNLAPILSEEDELDPNVPKMLCQMDNHLACVNVVRWSCEGHLLASGGDDKLVMVWKLTSEGSSAAFGSGGKINVETWKCIQILNSHSGDILDLAWAPHDRWLASGSVDNTVIIWNMQKFNEKIAVLKGHTGMVKGVAWDPVGKYLASQSDDKSLRVWRTVDWAQQEVVSEPFVDSSATTHVLRLAWSPDGQYLVSAHAMNGGGPTAQIVERDGWKHDKDFVGHRKAVTCVRFNSNILKRTKPGSPNTQQYCCCAIGSRDRSVSVWLTSLKRPLVVVKDIFDDSVLDISWNSDGRYLLACSWDGTVACIIFTPKQIGTPLSNTEKNKLYERMYGKSLQKNWNQSFTCSQIVETPELLQVIQDESEEKKDELTPIKVEITEPTVVKTTPSTVLVATNKQIETRLPSGKRRITPMFLKPAPVTPNDTLEIPKSTDNTSFSSSSPTKSKIIVETVKEHQPNGVRISTPVQKQQQPAQKPMVSPAIQTPAPGVHVTEVMCTEIPGDEPVVQVINVLEPLKAAPGGTVTKKLAKVKLTVTNNCHSTSKGSIARLEIHKFDDDSSLLWCTYIGSSVRCVTANRKILVASCEDMTLNSYNIRSGAKILPPLVTEDLAAALCLSESNFCLLLTKTGLLHMWDLEKKKCIIGRASVRSLLSKKISVTGCSISSSNLPIITLNDGKAYTYNTDLQTWILLSNPSDPVCKAGASLMRSISASHPLAALQRCMPLSGANDSLPSGVTLSFLESQIASSCALQSKTEFKYWLFATVNHLLDKGPECRLRSILDELMDASFIPSKKPKNDEIMGLSKICLLNDILAIIRTKLPWQRLYQEYREQINKH